MSRTLAYAGRRLLFTVPTLFVMSVFVFAIIHVAPGDPVQAALGLNYTPSAAHVLRHQMGLDQPIVTQ
jgi:peptide/nickel transport system permease protein